MAKLSSLLLLTLSLLLTACGGSDSKKNSAEESVNTKPIAIIEGATDVFIGNELILSGLASTDADNDILTYQWSLISAPDDSTTELASIDVADTSFIPDLIGNYQLQLVVSDGEISSEPIIFFITAATELIANAGDDFEFTMSNSYVTLDGSASEFPSVDGVQFTWSILAAPSESESVILSGNILESFLYADKEGEYVVELEVSNDLGELHRDQVSIFVSKPFKDVVLLKQQLTDNKAKWNAFNITNYQFDFFGPCGSEILCQAGAKIQLLESQKSHIYLPDKEGGSGSVGLNRPVRVSSAEYDNYKSVDELFARIEEVIDTADVVSVYYDTDLGYPTRVTINDAVWFTGLHYSYEKYSVDNLVNLDDVDCTTLTKKNPTIILNIQDELSKEAINSDVTALWQFEDRELHTLTSGEVFPIAAFGIRGEAIDFKNTDPFLIATETGKVSLTLSKEGYKSQTNEFTISDEKCGLIPTEIDVLLEPED